jgi:hypothetical protein
MTTGKKSYYGPLFWLSLIAFIVPLFVAAKAFDAAPKPYSKPVPYPNEAGVDHALWDYLLKAYVRDGLIDYDGMKRDYLFSTYLKQLGAVNPDALESDNERLALLCNAYNAFVVNGVIIHDIEDSVDNFRKGLKGFFSQKEHIFAGKTITLDHIEHTLIRPVFNEPRIHMALVCAAKSCPPIRPEAFIGTQVRAQLEDQVHIFANNTEHLRFDQSKGTLFINPILKWYGDDFDAVGGYLEFLAARAEDTALKTALQQASSGSVKVKFNAYDWDLNTQGKSASTTSPSAAPAEFGSGSVPNE